MEKNTSMLGRGMSILGISGILGKAISKSKGANCIPDNAGSTSPVLPEGSFIPGISFGSTSIIVYGEVAVVVVVVVVVVVGGYEGIEEEVNPFPMIDGLPAIGIGSKECIEGGSSELEGTTVDRGGSSFDRFEGLTSAVLKVGRPSSYSTSISSSPI